MKNFIEELLRVNNKFEENTKKRYERYKYF